MTNHREHDEDPEQEPTGPERSSEPSGSSDHEDEEEQHTGAGVRRPPPRAARQGREFVVIGLGRFGTSVAETLIEYGHDVLAIDADPQRVQQLATSLPRVVQLDATQEQGLQELGVGVYDTGLVSIGTDFESNLLATVMLLRLGVRRVIAKARTRTQKHILEQVGADEVILPEHEAGVRLARQLSHAHVVDYLEVSEDVDVVEIHCPSSLSGRSLRDAALRQSHGLSVIAIRRGEDTVVNPGPATTLSEDDVLVVVGRIEEAERLRD